MTGPIRERPMGWVSRGARGSEGEEAYDVGGLVRMARRRLPLVVIGGLIGMAIAVAMILGSVPRYRAIETVLLDEERSELLREVSPLPNAIRTDAAVQSELEIIKSQALARRVVDRIDLHLDQDFLNPPVGATQRAAAFVNSLTVPIARMLDPEPASPPPEVDLAAERQASADPEEAAMERAAAMLRGNLDVRRVGRSFVLEIGYLGYNPQRARDIARAYGRSYQTFQLDATTQVAANAGRWIQERLSVLERQSLEAAAAVQRFRSENDLVQVRGSLLTDQQQSELASELIRAAAQRAEKGAILDSLRALLDAPPSEALSVAALPSALGAQDVLGDLRQEYADTQRRYQAVLEVYGAENEQVRQLETALAELEAAAADALRRVVNAVTADYAIAQSREASLREDLESYADAGPDSDSAILGRLAQLEAVAETYQAVYRDYLERYELTTQQQAFPIASVQVISPAETPRGAASPQKKMMLATGLFLGGLIGALVGALLEMRPRRLRTAFEIEEELGLPCAGLAPKGASAGDGGRKERVMRRTATRVQAAIDDRRPAGEGLIAGIASVCTARNSHAFLTALVETVSPGKESTVLIVDAGGADKGLLVALQRAANVHVLDRSRLSEFEAALAAPDRASEMRTDYDYTFVLLPPLTEQLRADQMTQLIDTTVLTIPWGKVGLPLIRGALEDHKEFRTRLSTTVLDEANLRSARRYMRPGSYEEQTSHA